MNWCCSAVVVLCFFEVVNSKFLHTKETPTTEENEDIQFEDFLKYDDNVYTDTDRGRFARHVELVTESVLEHLMREINEKYPNSKNGSQDSIPKVMQRLKMKLKKHMKKKKKKDFKKKKQSKPNSTMHEMTTMAE